MHVTAFFTEYGVPKTGLSPYINIRRSDTGAIVLATGNMTDRGGGWYEYDFAGYDPTNPYSIRCDGNLETLDNRYSYGGNVIDTAEAHDTFEIANEILDLLENKLVISDATSELWLYVASGVRTFFRLLRDRRIPLRARAVLGLALLLFLSVSILVLVVRAMDAPAIRVFGQALALSALLAVVPVTLLHFLDRRERESPWLVAIAILWGALIALAVSSLQ